MLFATNAVQLDLQELLHGDFHELRHRYVLPDRRFVPTFILASEQEIKRRNCAIRGLLVKLSHVLIFVQLIVASLDFSLV